ncbi:MAG: GH3 auxin-responsive promoter family protein [Cyclobacteriaceae bacterium]
MEILGTLLKKGISLRESLEQYYNSPVDLQKRELIKLLIEARHTRFGEAHRFSEILNLLKENNDLGFYESFKMKVPVFDYDKINGDWWSKARAGKKNVCWPGKTKYYALSSGTSGAASKYIPVTKDMLKSIKRTSLRQMMVLSKCSLPDEQFSKGILMLGGSTDLRSNGTYFEGDLSGITTSQIPFWFQHFYKPGKRISKATNWDDKLTEITKKAKDWDIGIICGVPAWLQILMEKIIDHYQVETIHDIWPNLKIFVHGGVSFEPYRKGFGKLLGQPLIYLETYLASEGFIAFQTDPYRRTMKLVLNNWIFYEFVPFTSTNFTEDGEIVGNPETLDISEVKENQEYALLISTNAGTWRYLIGDVIKFVSLEESEIVITGRTKHFLSLCGEHLSVDNMNKAMELVSEDINVAIREFTVIGEHHGSLFAHNWYLGVDGEADAEEVERMLDHRLMELNDDYKVERGHALKEIKVNLLPAQAFYDWMKAQGKEGGQSKFPRVLKNDKAADWKQFLTDHNLISV